MSLVPQAEGGWVVLYPDTVSMHSHVGDAPAGCELRRTCHQCCHHLGRTNRDKGSLGTKASASPGKERPLASQERVVFWLVAKGIADYPTPAAP